MAGITNTLRTSTLQDDSDLTNTPTGGVPRSNSPKPTMIDLCLLCYIPSPLFHAHWSIFIPQRNTVINIRGDPLNGFSHEFERGYIPSEDPDTNKPPFMLKLAAVQDSLVTPVGPLEAGKDAVAHTELERLALSVPAPGPSLGRRASKDGRSRVEIRDCQWWIGQFVERMIQAEIIGSEAQEILDKAPKH